MLRNCGIFWISSCIFLIIDFDSSCKLYQMRNMHAWSKPVSEKIIKKKKKKIKMSSAESFTQHANCSNIILVEYLVLRKAFSV